MGRLNESTSSFVRFGRVNRTVGATGQTRIPTEFRSNMRQRWAIE
jgi:hypothetical protein